MSASAERNCRGQAAQPCTNNKNIQLQAVVFGPRSRGVGERNLCEKRETVCWVSNILNLARLARSGLVRQLPFITSFSSSDIALFIVVDAIRFLECRSFKQRNHRQHLSKCSFLDLPTPDPSWMLPLSWSRHFRALPPHLPATIRERTRAELNQLQITPTRYT